MTVTAFTLALVLSAKGDPRIAVLDVKSRAGVPEALAQGVSDSVASEVRRRAPKFSVISSDEIRSLLALEKQRQQLGCENVSCLAEIGGALGAQEMVTGSLALFGDLYVLSLKRVDVSRASVLREASGRLQQGHERDLPDLVARLCQTLFTEPSEAGEPPPPDLFDQADATKEPTSGGRSHTLGWTLAGTAVATGLTAAITGGVAGSMAGEFSAISANTKYLPAATAYGDLRTAQALEGVAIGCGIAALLAAGGAVIAW